MDSSIIITPTPDMDTMARIHAACFGSHSWDADAFAALCAVPGTIAALSVAHNACGVVRVVADEAEILTMAVLPEARMMGWGKKIVHALLHTSRTQHAARVFLEVRVSNNAAIALYTQAGFTLLSRRKGYYANQDGSAEDALVLQCQLLA